MTSLPIWLLRVSRTERLSPHMMRVILTGDDLHGFSLKDADQQVKLYFPQPGQSGPVLPEVTETTELMSWYEAYTAIPDDERPWMRSYTIRSHDPATNSIAIDFVLHKHAGPATKWVMNAQPGEYLGVFGPSAYFARPKPLTTSLDEADWVLLAGDDAAIPALGTIIERLPAGTPAFAYIEVESEADELDFTTRGDLSTVWLHRGSTEPGHGDTLLDAVRAAALPEGAGFAWVAGEAGSVRRIRRHLVQERGLPKRQVDFSGYWRLKLTQDDPPTADDLDEAQERVAAAQEAQST